MIDPRGIPAPDGFPRCVEAADAAATRHLGARLAGEVPGGGALLLHGPLGAGKTCLVQGFCEALGVTSEVISPTFALVNRYEGDTVVYHLDLYRIEAEDDLNDIGVGEILDELDGGGVVLLVEWPALLVPFLPERLELLALPGAAPDVRYWHVRGVPTLPAPVAALFPETTRSC